MIVQESGVLERRAALMLARELARHPQLDPAQTQELQRVENLLSTNDPSDLAAITRELRTIGRQLDDRSAQVEHLTRLVEGPDETSAGPTRAVAGAAAGPARAAVAGERIEPMQQLVAVVAMSTVLCSVLLVGTLILVLSPAKLFIATPLAVAGLVAMFKALNTVARQHRIECELLERAQVRAVRAELIARGVGGADLDAVERQGATTLTSAGALGGFSLDRALRGRGAR